MATFKSFEEIEAWQRARVLANRVYELSKEGTLAKDFKLRDQMNGSSGSIMDNIAEGFERDGVREFIQFLAIAKGSAGELRSQLYRASDRNHIPSTQFEELMAEVLSISKQISALMKYLRSTDKRGIKFMK